MTFTDRCRSKNGDITTHSVLCMEIGSLLNRISALNKTNQDEDHGYDKEDVYKPADGIYANNTEEPKKYKYDCDSIEHVYSGSILITWRKIRCINCNIVIFILVI